MTMLFRQLSALSLFLLSLLLSGCDERPDTLFQGYAEGEFVHVASPQGGRLELLKVRGGETARKGDLLFALETSPESQDAAEAEQELRRAEKTLDDLLKGERPTELAAVAARLAQARTRGDLSRQELSRREKLYTEKVISAEELDRARSAFERDRAAVRELEAQLATARLGDRPDRIAAARAAVAAAEARLSQARWRLEEKGRSAPAAGLVFDTLYEPGEFVPAGRPVVTLLPPEKILVRFFVPEPLVGTLKIGQKLSVTFDGAGRTHSATISFISPRAEYTPPVIYSRETRAKLVFLVEARPEEPTAFHPGQPVEVRPEGGDGG